MDKLHRHLGDRLVLARKLLVWWEATNHPDDQDSGLAIDTRKFLAFFDVEVPDLTDSALLYANVVDDEPSQLPPQPDHTDTTVLSLAHELHHAQLRRMSPDGLPDDHHKKTDNTPRTDDDSSVQCACRSQE